MEEKKNNYNGWLNSESLIKRSLAVLGHSFIGMLIIYTILFTVAFVIGLIIGLV